MTIIIALFVSGLILSSFLVFYGFRFQTLAKWVSLGYATSIGIYTIFLAFPKDTAYMLYSLAVVVVGAAIAEEYYTRKNIDG